MTDFKAYVPPEFSDITAPLDHGARKYGDGGIGWLEGKHFNHRDNHSSMCRHLAEHYMGVDADEESGLDPLLHLACRAMMAYTRKKRKLQDK